jgi:hypothetical protein
MDFLKTVALSVVVSSIMFLGIDWYQHRPYPPTKPLWAQGTCLIENVDLKETWDRSLFEEGIIEYVKEVGKHNYLIIMLQNGVPVGNPHVIDFDTAQEALVKIHCPE